MKTSFTKLLGALMLIAMTLWAGDATAQSRRPIDSQHPMWLVHIDVWNNADPQKIINLIPNDIKPYVCLNLSLSCSFDKVLGIHTKPQNAMLTYKSWATICQANNMWFTCQPASGGHTHIKDDDLATFEYMFKHYPNFLGWNYAEQFWGFDEGFDVSKGETANNSSTQSSRIALFAKLVEMSHNYGGFLTISFCGNIWSHGLNPNGMMSRNKDFLEACKKYPEAVLFLYKYTTSSCFYNNESVSLAPFISGLSTNYGVRYDNCGYNGALDALLGDNHGKKYPAAVGIGTVMEQTGINGGAVWDGPELIWTEDFQNLANSTVDGYQRRNWGRFKTFDNIWIDMFRKIIDGTLYIPTREEVIARNKVVIINNQSGDDQTKYAAPGDLYDGLYKQSDPFNRNNGQWMDNFLFLKKTGRYQPIPVVLGLYDDLAKSITKQVKRTNYSSVLGTTAKKQKVFNELYPEVSTGPLFVARLDNELITYYNHSYFSKVKTEEAVIPLQYNTCEELKLNYGKFTSGVVREYGDSITLYLNNYRTDSTSVVENSITVTGAKAEPTYTIKKRVNAKTSAATAEWDAETGTYTLTFKMMGPVDITIHCEGNATDRRTDARAPIALSIPKQPEPLSDDIIIEGEDMDYKSIASCVSDQYNSGYRSVRGHTAMGFADMGTNTSATLRGYLSPQYDGEYTVTVRYNCTTSGAKVGIKVNGSKSTSLALPKTATNEWRKASITSSEFKVGELNNFTIQNTGGKKVYIDNVTITPANKVPEMYEIRLQNNAHGTLVCEQDSCNEGTEVKVEAIPDEGYGFVTWEVVHGDIKLADAFAPVTTFVMPDDDVELRAVFKDNTLAYKLDYSDVVSGSIPCGWRVVQEDNGVHEYPNNYSSGSRTIVGFKGYQGAALYWRFVSAEYGRQTQYPLTLQPGDYTLTYACAAWKGTPTYNVIVATKSGDKVIAEARNVSAAPNTNGNSSASIASAEAYTLDVHITEAADYVIRFESVEGGWSEYLLAQCQLNVNTKPDAITAPANSHGQAAVYDLQGRKVSGKTHMGGIYIIRTDDGRTYKRMTK